jgi:glycosyltransferase involved in cell wall biosynthesis
MNILYVLADRGHDLSTHQGYAVHVKKILHGLEKSGHHTFLITINENTNLPGFGKHKCTPHRYVRGIHKILPYTGLYNSLRIFRAIMRLAQNFKFDLIHERYGLYSLGGVLAAHYFKIPYILEVNAPLIEEKKLFTIPLTMWQKRITSLISRLNLKCAKKIIVVSNILKTYLQHQFKVNSDKIIILPNAAEFPEFLDNRKVQEIRSKFSKDDILVGYVGTFQPWFGIEHLITGFAEAHQKINHITLLLVGNGVAKVDCEKLVHQLHLSAKVHFIGAIPHEEIRYYLSAMDIAVAPYVDLPMGFYGSSMKVFEYMAAGKAIIASRVGQIQEVLNHEVEGLLVPPGVPAAIARAIYRLAINPQLRAQFGENAMKSAREKYSWKLYVQRLEEVYANEIRHSMLNSR